MKSHLKLEITVGTLQSMTVEQFLALKNNILAEGKWDTYFDPPRIIGGGDYLGVRMPDGFYIGIEKDGYTHS